MRLRTLLVAMATLLIVSMAPSAQAAVRYCKGDPVFSINGQTVSVEIALPLENADDITRAHRNDEKGTVKVTLYLPRRVQARLLDIDETYFYEEVEIVRTRQSWDGESHIEGRVEVLVPSAVEFPVRVFTRTPDGDTLVKRGTSNTVIVDRFQLRWDEGGDSS
jgi:hypothetical protein